MSKQTVSIVIPVYNERESIEELLHALERVPDESWIIREYIFIDDGSSDGSFDRLTAFVGKLRRHLIVIRFRKNLGKSAAMSVGFHKSHSDYIVTLDADLQDDPVEIPKLLKKLDEGYEFVLGWRRERKDTLSKRISSKIFNLVVGTFYGVSLHDMNTGLKACTKNVTREISMYGELHRYMPVLAASRGFRITEVPVIHHARKFGKSKFSSSRVVHALFDLASTLFITTFEHEPMQMFGKTGGLGIVIGLIILVYLSVLHFQGYSIIGRPLLLLGILFVLFGMQMVSAGLIGELIIHKDRHNEQSYPVAEIIE